MNRDAVTIVNPAAEDVTARLALAPRVASLGGARVALIDNSKHNADLFLDTLATLLVRDHGVAKIERYRKAMQWRQAGLPVVERRPPYVTGSGKILHLHAAGGR